MSVSITAHRKGDALIPSAQMFLEDLHRIPEGREVVVTIKRSRSPKHLRTFFGKLRSAIELGLWDGDVDSLRSFISIGIGHCTTFVDTTSRLVSERLAKLADTVLAKHGEASEEGRLAQAILQIREQSRVYMIPKSIAEESMDQDEFNAYNERADAFIADRFGIDPQVLYQHMVDGVQSPLDQPATDSLSVAQSAPGTDMDTPLDERLRALGFELGYAKTISDFEMLWSEAKQRQETKALHQREPELLKEIVDAAKAKARGLLPYAQFEAKVRDAAKRALVSA